MPRTRNFAFRIKGVTCFQIACLETYNCVGMGYYTMEENGTLNLYGWVRHRYPKHSRNVSAYLGADCTSAGGVLPLIISLFEEQDNYKERGWRPADMAGGRSLTSIFEAEDEELSALVDLGKDNDVKYKDEKVFTTVTSDGILYEYEHGRKEYISFK